MFYTVILFSILLILLCHILVHHGKFGKKVNLIPGPMAIPFFGNTHQLLLSTTELWSHMRKLNQQYYPIFRLWGFSMAMVNVRHPHDIETLIGNTRFIRKNYIYQLLEPWFSTGLLTSAGRKWQTRRKILTPAFHFNVLQEFASVIIEEGEHFVKKLKSEGEPVVMELVSQMSEHTLNMICETAMGTSLKDKGEFQHKYRKAIYEMGEILVYRLVRPWMQFDFLFNLTSKGREQARLLKILHGFSRQIIQERKKYHEETNGRYLEDFSDSSNKKDDIYMANSYRRKRLAMLDLIIAAHRNNEIDDEGIREEVDTFMFRGHDTTAMALCFVIMLLAEHKKIQDDVRAEVKSVIDESDGKLIPSSLQKFSYLERCIKESLRLYPSVPFIARLPEGDTRLSGYNVPANTGIHIHLIDVHRDPQFWPNPDIFDPDRFLPENCEGRHPYSYIPFSAGPRNCIGQRFAMMEMKATLALILYNFELEPVDFLKDVSITADLVLRPAHPIRTKFKPLRVSS